MCCNRGSSYIVLTPSNILQYTKIVGARRGLSIGAKPDSVKKTVKKSLSKV